MMHILVTAGPTREYFDTVRFISNPSSGKMGYAIATAAIERGHDVVLVSGPVALPDPKGADVTRVTSAREMLEACVSALDGCDAVIMTAAVCDYRPSRQLDHKLKKHHRVRPIHLQPTEDILPYVGASIARFLGDWQLYLLALPGHYLSYKGKACLFVHKSEIASLSPG